MLHNFIQLLTSFNAFIINVLIVLIINRFQFLNSLLKTLLLGFLIGFFTVAIMHIIFLSFNFIDSLSIFIVNIAIYTALSYCFFNVIALAVTARRIRIIRELYKYEKGLTKTEILKIYNAKDMVDYRIKRMINSGQIISQNDTLYIGKPILLLIAKTIILMKIIFMRRISTDVTY